MIFVNMYGNVYLCVCFTWFFCFCLTLIIIKKNFILIFLKDLITKLVLINRSVYEDAFI